MAGLKNNVEENVLDYILTNESPDYLGLYLSDPSDSLPGAEVTTGSYARQAITLVRDTNTQVLYNSNTITFPQATASWGTVVAFAVCVSGTTSTDDQVMYGSLTASKTVVAGETLVIDPGEFTMTID